MKKLNRYCRNTTKEIPWGKKKGIQKFEQFDIYNIYIKSENPKLDEAEEVVIHTMETLPTNPRGNHMKL